MREGDIGKITPTLRRESNSAGSHIATANTKHDTQNSGHTNTGRDRDTHREGERREGV